MITDLITKIRDFGIEFFDRYYSIYRGIVVDNNDPEKRGRVKIKIPGLDVLESEVWAESWGQYCGKGYGEFYIPEINEAVYVIFEQGDLHFPIYIGSWYAKDELPSEFKNGYKGKVTVRGIKTKYGHKIIFDDDSKKIEISTKDGRRIIIDDNDKIVIDNKNKRKIVLSKDEILIGGDNATQPLVLGYRLVSWLIKLYAWAQAVGGMTGITPASFNLEPPSVDKLTNIKHKQTTN